MNKNFALLSIIAFAEAVKLECSPCSSGCNFDDGDGDDDDDFDKPIIDITEEAVTAFIFENDDCTGEALSLDLFEDGDTSVVYDTAALFTLGWDDRGASLLVPRGTFVELFQHSGMTGESEEFFSLPEGTEDHCQKMSDNLANQMSYVTFAWD